MTIFLADTLQRKQHAIYNQLINAFHEYKIPWKIIPDTIDIWARDYMPIKVTDNHFIRFRYEPSYIMNTKKLHSTISDVSKICNAIGIQPIYSNINLDGGNVVKYGNKAIITDKIFKENSHEIKEELLNELQHLLKLEKLTIISHDEFDFTGHADGMVRFVNADTVIVNNYSDIDSILKKRLLAELKSDNYQYIEILCLPSKTDKYSAHGFYINYLQTDHVIFLPIFKIQEDEQAINQFKSIFPNHIIHPIDCTELAPHGGLLNCISWEM